MMQNTCAGSRATRIALIAAFSLIQSCTSVQTTTQTQVKLSSGDEQAIFAARAAQNRAMASGDAASAAEFWTDDVEMRRGLGQLVVGRDNYKALLAITGNRDSSLVYEREPNSIEISTQWPLAYESGVWSGHLGRIDGPSVIQGRYSAQWVKRGGKWLIRGEVFVALTCSGVGCANTAAP